MASFGGAVKLTGESEYRAALRHITQNLKEVSSEMKMVSSQYDKSDTSTQALTAKQGVLNEKLEQQKQRLSTLQAQYAKMSDAYQTNTQKHEKLVQSYEQEKAKLESIGKELGTSSDEYKQQEDRVKQLSEEVKKSSKNQDANAKSLSNMRIQMNNATTDINKTKAQIGELGEQLEKSADSAEDMGKAAQDAGDKAERAGGGGFTVLKGALANLAGNIMQSAINGIQNLAGEAISSSDALKKFESTMSFAGYDSGTIEKAKSDMKDYADKTVYDLDTVANTTAQLAANGIQDYTGLTQAAGNLNAVAGGNADTFQSVAMVMTQTAGAGKLTTENWNQLADAIPGASGKIQEALLKNGAYTGNFRDAMAQGQITADEFNQAIMDLGFTDAAQEAATSTSTFEGAMGNMEAAVTDGLMQIYDAIGSENVTAFINGISDAVSAVIPPIKEGIQWLKDNLPAIAPMLATIAAGLGALMVAQQIDQMISAFRSWKTATEGLTIAQRLLNAAQLSSPVGLVLAGVTALVAGLVVLWNTNEDFRNAVTNAWNQIQEVVGSVASAIGNFFTQTIPEAVNTVKDAIVNFFTVTIPDAFNSALEAIGNWATGIGTMISQLPAMFTEWLGGVIDSVANWAASLAQSAMDAGSQFVNGVMQFITNLPYNIGFALGTVIGTVISWTANFIANAQQAGSQFLSNVVTFVQQLPGMVASFLSSVISSVVSWASNMASNARNAGSQFINNVVAFIQQLPGRIAGFLGSVISNVASWASNMASNASRAGSQFISNVINFISQLPGRIAGFLSSVIGQLAGWAGEMASAGARGASSMLSAVVNGLASLPGQVAGIGRQIVQGIWSGISGAAGWLASQVRSFASGILDGMKNALGIHSPSRVFRDQVGKYIAQGIGVGFESEMKSVSADMQDAIPTSFDLGTAQVDTGTHGTAIQSGYYNVVEAFKEALSEMKIEMNDEEMGRFVDRTVTNLVYS